MPNTEPGLANFADHLVFKDCADGSVDLVDAETPEWAREIYYNLPTSDRRDVERAAWEKIQKDRRENV